MEKQRISRPIVVGLVAAAFWAMAVSRPRADTIEFKATGLKIEGKVERETVDFVIFLVHDDKGAIRIPRSKIKSIEYDVKTQLDKLSNDDNAGHMKVAQWAIDKGMLPEAIQILEELKGAEGIGPERYKMLGQCYESRQQLDKALENYSDYLKANPDDAAIKEKVAKLTLQVNPNAVKTPANPDVAVPAKPAIVNGLEGDGQWLAENWGHPGKAQFTTEPATGNKMVVAVCEGGDKDKFAISRVGQPLNLSDSKEILFKIFHNSPTPVNMAVAFQNSQGEFHETKQFRIPGNSWESKSQKIDGKVFKANRNNFEDFNQELDGKERITKILFLIYGQRPFNMYIDGVFFK
jgi:tetratricopeptide (TPR) repeat protein